MWGKTFSQRLLAWNQLRAECAALDTDTALERINSWWHQTPWRPYYLHWDYRDTWPGPWEILDDNIYCTLTRALGMMYTILILDLAVQAELAETSTGDHVVLINQGEKILNTGPDTTLNTEPSPLVVRRLTADYFNNKF